MSKMSNPPQHQKSKSERFIAASTRMPEGGSAFSAPVRWITALIQSLIALMLVTFAKAIELSFRRAREGENKRRA